MHVCFHINIYFIWWWLWLYRKLSSCTKYAWSSRFSAHVVFSLLKMCAPQHSALYMHPRHIRSSDTSTNLHTFHFTILLWTWRFSFSNPELFRVSLSLSLSLCVYAMNVKLPMPELSDAHIHTHGGDAFYVFPKMCTNWIDAYVLSVILCVVSAFHFLFICI